MKYMNGKINTTDLKTIHNFWRLNMKIIAKIGTLTVLFFLSVGVLWAGEITGGVSRVFTSLKTYVDGEYATAYDVNQNFAVVREEVNNNDSRITTNDTRISSLESGAFILNQNETVTGRPSFNGGTSGSTPPFYVDSNYQIANLNADYLDGYHASSFLLTSRKPVIATGSYSNRSISTDSNIELTSVNITTTGAGYVLVTGECFINVSHINTYDSHYVIGVGTSPTVYTEYTMTGVPKTAGSGMHLMSVSVSYPFYVGSAGTYTYYMTGRKNLEAGRNANAVRNRIVAVFIPN